MLYSKNAKHINYAVITLFNSLDFPARLTSIICGSQYGSLGYQQQFSFPRRVLAVGGKIQLGAWW